jgi:serine protease
MSFDGPVSVAVEDAVNAMIDHGIVVVAAAGNENEDACNYSPANVTNALTVGATTANDRRADYSNYGSCLDLFAPGSSIQSAWIGSSSATNTLSGTSMAASHVTVVAAIYLQTHATASVASVSKAILNVATKDLITDPGTGSANKLIYSLVNGGESSVPIIVSPSGSIADSTPIYRWSSYKQC